MTDGPFADRIFTGGSILTMQPDYPRVEAVAVAGGRVLAAGTERDVLALRGPNTTISQIGDHALLPGFVDGHGHLAKLAASLGFANLSAPPVGPADDIDSLVGELQRFAHDNAADGDWIVGRGYDPAFMSEGRHPTRHDLDRASAGRPIYITHVSGHLAVANTAALQRAGVSAETPDPPGGVIRREEGGQPTGLLEESALRFFGAGVIPPAGPDAETAALAEAQRIYAAAGITTAQEGAMFPLEQAQFEAAAANGRLFLDVVGYAYWATSREMLRGRRPGDYVGRFKHGGVKLILDGSPQGKTAWLTQPYHVPPDGAAADYCGYPAMPDEQAVERAEEAYREGWQVIAHCNGDAAADQFLRVIAQTHRAHPGDGRRPVMIHAQTVRDDQLDAMADLGVVPSFFASHVYYWGDFHRDSVLGAERAERISPLRSAQSLGLRFNLHNDSPVVPPDILRLVWCAVERRTRSGAVLGPDQAIDVMAALRAVTIDAAYAHFEENTKGSIAPGKLADLVVLGADPARVAPSELAAIPIIETLKEGVTIYPVGPSAK